MTKKIYRLTTEIRKQGKNYFEKKILEINRRRGFWKNNGKR